MIKSNINLGNGITISIENTNRVNAAGSLSSIVSSEWMPAVEMAEAIDGLKKISNECIHSAEHFLAIYSTESSIGNAVHSIIEWILKKLKQLGDFLQKLFAKFAAFVTGPIHKKAEKIVNGGFSTDYNALTKLNDYIKKMNSKSSLIKIFNIANGINKDSNFKNCITTTLNTMKNEKTIASNVVQKLDELLEKYKKIDEGASIENGKEFANSWKTVNTAFNTVRTLLGDCETMRKYMSQSIRKYKNDESRNEYVKILKDDVSILGAIINQLVQTGILQGMMHFDFAIIKAHSMFCKLKLDNIKDEINSQMDEGGSRLYEELKREQSKTNEEIKKTEELLKEHQRLAEERRRKEELKRGRSETDEEIKRGRSETDEELKKTRELLKEYQRLAEERRRKREENSSSNNNGFEWEIIND
jgi:hypothetical protein